MKQIFTITGLWLLLLTAVASVVHAQAKQDPVVIRGTVTDRNQRAVSGVSVVELDGANRAIAGTETDADGNYALKTSGASNHKISFSGIGFKTFIQSISGKTKISVTLEPGDNHLDEVIISSQKTINNGTGLNISDRNKTTAVTSISAKELEEMQAASIDQALQGRLSGVDIAATSGDPGKGMQIRIRGTSSISAGSDPLVVVDGMPYEVTIPDGFNFATSDDQGFAQLLNIAPSDIKDITILKDAASTAVWGSRAANGVLIITTKRGAVGKPVITYTFKGSLAVQPGSVPLLNGDQYSTLIPEEYNNGTGKPMPQTIKEFNYNKRDPYWYYNYSNNTNWVDAITQKGLLHDHNISVSGGGARAKYFASLGYFNQTGTTIGTSLQRITTRINLDYTVSDRLRFRTDIAYTHVDNNQLFTGSNDVGVRAVAYTKMPNMSIYEYDEYGNKTPNYFSPASNVQGYFYYDANGRIKGTYNPVAMARSAKNVQLGERVTPHFSVQYSIVPGVLLLNSDVQFDINTSKVNTFLPQIATGRPVTETSVNRASDADFDAYNVQTKNSLIYSPHLPESHTLQAQLMLQTNDYRYIDQQVMTSNTASSNLQDPAVPSRTQNDELIASSANTSTRSVGALLNAQYSFLDRYIINAGIRGDGNSRFGPANRYGLFPSLSARWRISGEPFMKHFTFINDLSVRASYGQSGNAPRKDYTFYNTYGNFDWTYMGLSGVYSQNIELTNLKWETVIGQNLGLDISLLKSRIVLTAEVYRNRTKNMIYSGLQVATTTGYDAIDMNAGTMDNQGWEISLNTTVVKNKVWQVDFNFNLAHNENVIRYISPMYPRESAKSAASNGVYKSYLQENNPFGSFYGYRYKGVYKDKEATVASDASNKPITGLNGETVYTRFNYPSVDYVFQPGDAAYEDVNHDGNIDYRDIVYLGNGNPRFTGGFGPSVSYKSNWRVSAFFSFRTGYDLINGTRMSTTNMYGYDNQSTAVLRRWRNEGDVTDVPRALYNAGYNWLGSSRYVEDGSFLRWRTLTVRYNCTKDQLKKLGLKSFSVYVTGENLFTLTRYTGQDPEVTTKISGPFSTVVDNSMTPPVKTYTIGIAAGF
ncbi:TonB-linked outer membrane protein, SusC/RagA family [Filimonas lacunae]|uniref:TonB-linked outer membrane protein, SusC/RagA family n=1 Tax=Filimonas lacunae TaxID=477680 RepID=A0A173MD33_9BACT|nr:SusC/RagA family TonB-linked outer membrane protein [Filimonas lacunae]BAV05427.1 outer membrane protein, nutrient binding [Filimonas lacunae]SIT21216.1 TonB-linked outer membrane protein, SusC/RagA family [Filimonas lacunae]